MDVINIQTQFIRTNHSNTIHYSLLAREVFKETLYNRTVVSSANREIEIEIGEIEFR